MPKYAGTVAEFIVNLFAAQPDLEWRIAEIVAAGDNKWNAANVANTLARMLKAGKVKKNVSGGVWWSAASAGSTNAKLAKVGAPAAGAKSAATPTPVVDAKSEPAPLVVQAPIHLHEVASQASGPTAVAFILELLTKHPDHEMQVADIWEESDKKWAAQTISNTLEKLVAAGKVARVKDGRNVWYSIAGK